jgi:hypothetical protein
LGNGIIFEVIWFDQDVFEFVVSCSNGCFAGRADIYTSRQELSETAGGLRGFPSSISDSRILELGTFNPSHADGGVKMRFYCLDSSGHAVVEVQLRGNACKALGEPESVALRIPIETAEIDSFILQLNALEKKVGASAALAMAV